MGRKFPKVEPVMETGMGGVDDDSPPGSRVVAPAANRGIAEEKLPHDPAGQGPMMRKPPLLRPYRPPNGHRRPMETSGDPNVGTYGALEHHQLIEQIGLLSKDELSTGLANLPTEAQMRRMATDELEAVRDRIVKFHNQRKHLRSAMPKWRSGEL